MPSAILMGSKPGAVVALSILRERGWDIPYVVVGDAPEAGWLPRPTLSEAAEEHGLEIVRQRDLPKEPESVDTVISYMFRHLVKGDVLAMARVAAVNFHAGPLPEFGGWAFYSVAILEDAPEYGCTCHHMDESFDTGPLLEVARFPIDASRETAVTLERKAQEAMIGVFVRFCERVERGEDLPRIEQDPSRFRYLGHEEFDALKRVPDDADAATVDRYARAFWYPPYECAYIETVSAGRVELVPEAAKQDAAAALHEHDLERLRAAASA